jgi:hypothetical protein
MIEKKYISGIFINELSESKNYQKPIFFAINLNTKIGIEDSSLFEIAPHILDNHILDNNIISFCKTYPNKKDLSLTYYGEKHQHPIDTPPYVGHYQLKEKGIIGKSIFVASSDPEAVLKLPCLNVLGQEYLSQDCIKNRIVKLDDLSAIIKYDQKSKRQSFQNRFSL